MDTLLLDIATWDLTIDAYGNIAKATDPYSTAQDVATQCRLFEGELWYDTTQGVPYKTQILGKPLSVNFLKAQLTAAAMLVPGVASVEVFITGFNGRQVTGQIQFVDTNGNAATIAASAGTPWYVSAINPIS